jgi:hypothetical protein
MSLKRKILEENSQEKKTKLGSRNNAIYKRILREWKSGHYYYITATECLDTELNDLDFLSNKLISSIKKNDNAQLTLLVRYLGGKAPRHVFCEALELSKIHAVEFIPVITDTMETYWPKAKIAKKK